MWYDTFDGIFFTTIATVVFAFLGIAVRYMLKSKCEHFQLCCGLITVDRRVDLEVQEEMHELDVGIAPDTFTPSAQIQRAVQRDDLDQRQPSPRRMIPNPLPSLPVPGNRRERRLGLQRQISLAPNHRVDASTPPDHPPAHSESNSN